MSLLSSIKKVLGYPDEYDEDDEDLRESDSTDDQPASRQSAVGMRIDVKPMRHAAVENNSEHAAPEPHPGETIEIPADEPVETPSVESELPGEIFDALIRLFNSTQPEFVANCLNVESQRAYLLKSIDEGVRSLLIEIAENARRRGQEQWNATRAKMAQEMQHLMDDYKTLKQQREDFQNEQLSSVRQKRALAERIRDLEAKVGEQTAEIEQYQLENRSMASRLRAMSVRAGITADDPAQKLSEENIKLQDRIAELENRIEESNLKITDLNKKLEETADAETVSAEQQAAIAEIEERMKQFEEIKEKKDKKISTLIQENRRLTKELESSNSSNDSAAAAQQAEVLKSEIDTLSAAKTALENEISGLRTENKKILAQLDLLRKESAEKEQRPADSDEVVELRQEVRRLTELINAASIKPVHKSKRGRKKKKYSDNSVNAENSAAGASVEEPTLLPDDTPRPGQVKISAIDELMDSTDWFTAPDPIPIKKDPEVDEEFGYKEPVRKPTLDSDKQLSLF